MERYILIGTILVLLLLAPVHAEESEWVQEATPEDALTYIWLLLTGGLVFLMQAGFAMLEAGFTRSKNTVNILMKNLMDFSVGILVFWAVGYGIMWGAESNLFFGYSDFFLSGFDAAGYNGWFFQMVFAATAATIVSGAMAERTKFKAYMVYTAIVTAIIYPVYNHWVWSGNGLFWVDGATSFITGYFGVDGHDFAGSGVVHAVGGYVALAGAIVLGPRIGKFVDGKPQPMPGHNMGMAALGAFLLAFGWLGFNGGSTLSGLDINYNLVVVNTFLAAGAGAVAAMLLSWAKGKPDIAFSINGLIAGLVAITAPCGSVDPWAAVVIGAIGGVVMYFGYLFNENVLKVDDPIGAVPVHGYAGSWGVISVGIFSNGVEKIYAANAPGLLYGGTSLFGVQVTMAVVNFLWAFIAGLIMFKVIDLVVGLRVTPEEEMEGLDLSEHGMSAYPEWATA